MKKLIPLFIVLIFVLLAALFALNIWKSEKKKSNNLMQNGVVFTGKILNLNASNNHAFGVIKLKIKETNSQNFINSNIIYPYQIKDSIAEVYHIITYNIHKGMIVKVDSNKQKVFFFDSDSLIYSSDLTIITDDMDKNFVLNNSQINRKYSNASD